ncbi:MAG TPA: hypothetical protein VMR17_14020 [Xanthobacteraceae bacterium]|jgi:hypothetical protein|nr:hypothetical protein [Xanthobacteraceae bacterium]
MKRFIAKKYLSTALALAAFGAAGTLPAFAQSRDHTGSMMPFYYESTGAQVTGSWAPATPAPVTQPAGRLFMRAEMLSPHHHRDAAQNRR